MCKEWLKASFACMYFIFALRLSNDRNLTGLSLNDLKRTMLQRMRVTGVAASHDRRSAKAVPLLSTMFFARYGNYTRELDLVDPGVHEGRVSIAAGFLQCCYEGRS
jgi:hypothetical protein